MRDEGTSRYGGSREGRENDNPFGAAAPPPFAQGRQGRRGMRAARTGVYKGGRETRTLSWRAASCAHESMDRKTPLHSERGELQLWEISP